MERAAAGYAQVAWCGTAGTSRAGSTSGAGHVFGADTYHSNKFCGYSTFTAVGGTTATSTTARCWIVWRGGYTWFESQLIAEQARANLLGQIGTGYMVPLPQHRLHHQHWQLLRQLEVVNNGRVFTSIFTGLCSLLSAGLFTAAQQAGQLPAQSARGVESKARKLC